MTQSGTQSVTHSDTHSDTHTQEVECTEGARCRVPRSTWHGQPPTQHITATRQLVPNSRRHYVVTRHLIRQCAVAVTNQHARIITDNTNSARSMPGFFSMGAETLGKDSR